MIYLSGAPFKGKHDQIGLMATPDTGNVLPPDTWWAFDNACFNHSGEFDFERWRRVLNLRLAESPNRCLFVVAPDVPFDAEGTVRRFSQYRDQLVAMNLPLAFVTQDGMGSEDVPWRDVAVVFVGGSTLWKTSVESIGIIAEAKRRRLWAHMGRVNGYQRLRDADAMGCDSADGTFLKFGPDTNWQRLIGWLALNNHRPPMRLGQVTP